MSNGTSLRKPIREDRTGMSGCLRVAGLLFLIGAKRGGSEVQWEVVAE
jgi:hypothetical protein